METNAKEFKEVYFHENCKLCKHKDVKESDEPCRECLDNPINSYSHVPIKFEKREEK